MFGLGRQARNRAIRRILVVEDEPLVAFDTEHMLVEAGYEVVATVDTAAAALRHIEEGAIDLVAADMNLRGSGSGIDIARAAHAEGICVLFISGQNVEEARAYAVGCLAKPYGHRDLLGAIEVASAIRSGAKPRRVPAGLTLFTG